MKKKDRMIPLLILVAVIIVIVLTIITINSGKEPDYSKMQDDEKVEAINNTIAKIEITELSDMTEKERMERYVGSFLENIRNKKYENAYGMLYEDFKTRYFKTLEDFESYAKTKFSSRVSVEYTNIERNGEIYVLWVNLNNPLKSKTEAKEMNFVIQENALGDFVLSFSV